MKTFFFSIFQSNSFFFIDLFIYFVVKLKYTLFNLHAISRINYKVKELNQGFYFNFFNNSSFIDLKNIFFSGWNFFWKAIRYWVVALTLGLIIFYYLSVIRLIPFNKVLFGWIAIIMFSYWLLSGFVFFVKKYQFGKYTSVIQRFWRRSYIIFWILEAFLFTIFLYLTINAAAESFYMFDQIQFFKTHLFSWRFFLLKLLPLTFLISISYIYLNSVRWSFFSKHILFLIPITFVLTYVVWVEFYQFFHIIHYYGHLTWIYDIDEHTWVLENEPKHMRIINHYTNVLLIVKFWHIIIIYLFWIFFLLRAHELNRVRYPLLSVNLQNFVILYLFAWVSMYPWAKFYLRKFLDMSYFWFYINNRQYLLRILFNDLKLIYFGLTSNVENLYIFTKLNYFRENKFFYWQLFSSDFSFDGFKRHFLKNEIIRVLSF